MNEKDEGFLRAQENEISALVRLKERCGYQSRAERKVGQTRGRGHQSSRQTNMSITGLFFEVMNAMAGLNS